MALDLKERLARQAGGETQLAFDPTGGTEPRLALLPLELIDPDPDQPRKSTGNLADLALSIQEHGLIQPLIVEPMPGGRYRLLAGERRFCACRSLALTAVPCVIRTVAEQSRLALQIIENLHRKDLHPLEEAQACRRLMEEFNLEQKELARRLGKSPNWLCETLRLLDLGAELQDQIRTSESATKSVLLEIAKEPDPARRQALWLRVQSGGATVSALRAERRRQNRGTRAPRAWKSTLSDARITVRFRSGVATAERVASVLAAALAQVGGVMH